MAPRHHSLLLLRLPGNVEREIYRIKNEILRISGAVSSQVPPVLPLAVIKPEAAESVVDSLPQTAISPLCLGPIVEASGYLVVSTVLVDYWERLKEAAGSAPGGQDEILTGLPGFLVASTSDVEAKVWQSLDSTALPKRVSVVCVENWSIEVRGNPWWIDYTWQVAWSRRIKLRG